MKQVYCYTKELWEGHSICYVNGSQTLFPFDKESPRQECLSGIEAIQQFAKETKADYFMFGFRAAGIHSKAVEVSKADKDLKALARILGWPKQAAPDAHLESDYDERNGDI